MNWLWAYFRRKAAEAIRAGVYDALAAENGATGLTDEQASNAMKAIAVSGNPVTTVAASGENAITPGRPQLAAPHENGREDQPEPPRRGPGRPRKFQEPSE